MTDYGRDLDTGVFYDYQSVNVREDEMVTEAVEGIGTTTIVSCPLEYVKIPGAAAGAYSEGDCVGTVVKVAVPKRGVIISATLLELSDTTGQYDLEIFKQEYTAIASNAAWAPTDSDLMTFVTELAFPAGDNQINAYTFELTNIGKAYTAPQGYFYIQCVDRGTKTIVANMIPHFQLQIQSFDPGFKES